MGADSPKGEPEVVMVVVVASDEVMVVVVGVVFGFPIVVLGTICTVGPAAFTQKFE